jgi:hypothetical protein
MDKNVDQQITDIKKQKLEIIKAFTIFLTILLVTGFVYALITVFHVLNFLQALVGQKA